MSLVGACRTHDDLELAQRTSKQLLEKYSDKQIRAAVYTAMANIYASMGLFHQQEEMFSKIQEEGIKKNFW